MANPIIGEMADGSVELEDRLGKLNENITNLRAELKADLPKDRFDAIEKEILSNREAFGQLMEEKTQRDQVATVARLDRELSEMKAQRGDFRPASKAGRIAVNEDGISDDPWKGQSFLGLVADARRGDGSAFAELKATLGTSTTTGQFLLPNNFVAELVTIAVPWNPYRSLMNVITDVKTKAIDIPYESQAVQRAKLQGGLAGSYGSNKETWDVTLASSTATMYTIAQIRDVGNQFLRQSSGAAETMVRNQLGKAIGLSEAYFVLNGTGTSQPGPGLLVALAAGGAGVSTARASLTRSAAIGVAIGAVEARGAQATGGVVHPTDFWTMVTELGTANGNFMVMPLQGATLNVPSPGQPQFPQGRLGPALSLWGVPIYRDANLTVGTAIVGDFADSSLFIGSDYTVDVSSEGANRFDQNVTGFRVEEDIALTFTPYVAAGYFQRITGM